MPPQELAGDRAPWNVYWLALGAFLVVLAAQAVAGGRGLGWAIAVALPLIVAALDLILFNRSHERVCATETRRHRWLHVLTMGGYDARTFALTGIALLLLAVALVASSARG